jgi:hypothetical protein
MKKISLILLMFMFFSTLKADDEYRKVKETVRMYQDMVITSSMSRQDLSTDDDMKAFEMIVSKKLAQRLYVWLQAWHDDNLHMDAKLLKNEFKKVEIDGKKAVVQTEENWVFRYVVYVSDNDVNEVEPPEKIYYNMRYNLAKVKGIWKIINMKTLVEKKL